MPIHHAPWSRRFTTYYCNGWFAHEIQIGRTVIQWAHKPVPRSIHHPIMARHLLIWRATS